MTTCPSCGGVLGRDCFNPQECAEISHAENMRVMHGFEQAQSEMAQLSGELKSRDERDSDPIRNVISAKIQDALQARDERIRLLEVALRRWLDADDAISAIDARDAAEALLATSGGGTP